MLDDKNRINENANLNLDSNGNSHKIVMQPIEDEMKKAY